MKTVLGILGAAFIAGLALVPTVANATCAVTVYADRTYNSNTYTYQYGRPGSAYSYIYYGYSTDPDIRAALNAATASRARVYLYGNASSCGTSTTGYRYIGNILYAYISP